MTTSYMPDVRETCLPTISWYAPYGEIQLLADQHARANSISVDEVVVDYHLTEHGERILRFRAPQPRGSYFPYANLALYRMIKK